MARSLPLLLTGLFACGGDKGAADMAATDMTPSAADLVPLSPCADYCAQVLSACATMATSQYSGESQCLGYCTTNYGWPSGRAGDSSGNSLACRVYHAGAAKGVDPVLHCPHAGPSGGNFCGTWCEVYCDLALRNCKDGLQVYADRTQCLTACVSIPAGGKANDTSGNTIQCRIYHAGLAGTDAPNAVMHCPHVRAVPTGPCAL